MYSTNKTSLIMVNFSENIKKNNSKKDNIEQADRQTH